MKTRVYQLCPRHYKNLSQLAQVMGISVSHTYRVRQGKHPINQKSIIGALQALPEYKFNDLFYFTNESQIIKAESVLVQSYVAYPCSPNGQYRAPHSSGQFHAPGPQPVIPLP